MEWHDRLILISYIVSMGEHSEHEPNKQAKDITNNQCPITQIVKSYT